MRYQFWILILFLFSKFNGFSQEKFVQHIVAKGETISKIAQQYNVKPSVIYEMNPDAKKGIKFKEILLVPVTSARVQKHTTNNNSQSVVEQKQHLVLAKETLYGIARQYGIKVNDLYAINPDLQKKGLRVGHNINVPVTESKAMAVEKAADKNIIPVIEEKKDVFATTPVDASGNYRKEVLAKETLYGIAKEYGVSVVDIERANPVLESQSLKIGQELIIPNTKNLGSIQQKPLLVQKEEVKDVADKKTTVPALVPAKEITVTTEKESEIEITREVLAKETKYGIAKEYGLTVKELEAQNPKIVNRLLVGEKLSIRTLKSNVNTAAKDYFSNAALNVNAEKDFKVNSFNGTEFVDQLISTASENIGVRYRTGGTSKDGFDCSGLMCTTFGAFDIQLPRSSFEQSQYGVKIDTEDAKKGDLIFFKTNGRSRINHVGMVVEVAADGEIKFIHASVGNGVIISSVKEKYYSKRVTQINRVL